MRTLVVSLLSLFVLLFLNGCGRGDVFAPFLEPTLTPSELIPLEGTAEYTGQIDQAEQLWLSQNINDYRMKVTIYQALAVGLTVQHNVTIKDGQVVEQECISEECLLITGSLEYTVPGLFKEARAADVGDGLIDTTGPGCATIGFDEAYGFPTFVDVDCYMQDDEEYSVKVEEFEVLEATE